MSKENKGLIGNFKELGFKGFMNKWGEGIQRIEPEALLKTEILSLVPIIIGLLIGFVIFTFIRDGLWFLGIVMLFGAVMNVTQLIAKLQQKKKLEEMKTQILEIQGLAGGEE